MEEESQRPWDEGLWLLESSPWDNIKREINCTLNDSFPIASNYPVFSSITNELVVEMAMNAIIALQSPRMQCDDLWTFFKTIK